MAIPKVRIELANRLRRLRAKQGLTQEEVAEKAGLDFRYYQRLESRKPNAVKIDTLD
jgi:transcriptional regulator with XRE-family HTH domain